MYLYLFAGDGNKAGGGRRSGWRLAVLCLSDPRTAAEAGPASPLQLSLVPVNVNTIDMFVVRPAQLKGESETTEP